MEIVNFGFFNRVDNPVEPGIIFFENEDGDDWYDLVRQMVELKPNGSFVSSIYGVWAATDEKGVVTHVEVDPTRIVPDGKHVLGINADTSQVSKGMRWDEGSATLLPPLPDEVAVPASISDRQFFQALASSEYNIISEADALAAVKSGEIPEPLQAVIDKMPASDKFSATMLLSGATEFRRDNPLTSIIGQTQGMDDEAIDNLFIFAAKL